MPKGQKHFGEKGWCSGESTRLPLMWCYLSQRRGFMWVKYVLSSHSCSERFFSGQRRIQRRSWGPPLFLDQTEAPRVEKYLGETASPPYLRVWMTAPLPPLFQGLDLALTGTPVLSTLSSKSNNLIFYSASNAYHYIVIYLFIKRKRKTGDKWTKTRKASYQRSWKEFFL